MSCSKFFRVSLHSCSQLGKFKYFRNIWQSLETFLVVVTAGSTGCCQASHNAQDSPPTTKDYVALMLEMLRLRQFRILYPIRLIPPSGGRIRTCNFYVASSWSLTIELSPPNKMGGRKKDSCSYSRGQGTSKENS